MWNLEFGFCCLNVVSVRAEPSFISEIVTQLLFGDGFELLERKGIFARIRMAYDGYEGWIDGRQCAPLDAAGFDAVCGEVKHVVFDPFGVVRSGEEQVLVVRGSSLPGYRDGKFGMGEREYDFAGGVVEMGGVPCVEQVLEFARLYLNTPYLWGGRSPCGIDCSALVQLAFKRVGIRLLRDSGQQLREGEEVSSVGEIRPGDLAFAESKAGGHVGLMLGEGEIIHASGRVRVDRLDERGILNVETGEYSHQLVGIRRYL